MEREGEGIVCFVDVGVGMDRVPTVVLLLLLLLLMMMHAPDCGCDDSLFV
jgi:hypothetical protein